MPRSVNIFKTNWRATGVNVQVPQYEVVVRFDWIDDAGLAHTGSRTVRFPNVLLNFNADELREIMEDILIRAARRLEVGDV